MSSTTDPVQSLNVTVGDITPPEARPGLRIPARIEELDGIRGIAALLVVFHHIAQAGVFANAPRSLAIWLALTHAGWLGVDIFFALSGFLITRTLLGSVGKPHYYRNFYMRRVLRLMPAYLLTLVLVAAFVPHAKAFILLSLVYLANFSEQFGVPMMYAPLWSLAVEEHFYLIWPWLVRFLRRRMLFAIAMVLCIALPLFRFVAQRHGFYNPYFSWFRFDGLLWGAMLALLVRSPDATRSFVWRWSTAVGLIGLVGFLVGAPLGMMSRQSVAGSSLSFALVSMATTGLIGHAALGSARGALALFRNPVLRFFGDISYWMYLFQVLALEAAAKVFPVWVGWMSYLEIAGFVLLLSIVTGVVVRRWVELPALSLKSRFH